MKLQQLETQEGERHCEEHLKQVKQNFFWKGSWIHTKEVFLCQIGSLEDEVFQLKSVLRDEQEKTRQQSTAMQVQINQARALIQVRNLYLLVG